MEIRKRMLLMTQQVLPRHLCSSSHNLMTKPEFIRLIGQIVITLRIAYI